MVLYELHFSRPSLAPVWMAIALAFLAFCLWGLWTTIGEVRRRQEKRRKLLGPGLLALLGLLAFWGIWISPVTEYLSLRSACESGAVRTAEGAVSGYDCRQGGNGIWYERFTVNGVEFTCDNWNDYPGYAVRGGVFSPKVSAITGDGQQLRVTYVPDWPYEDGRINAIVRIEELS